MAKVFRAAGHLVVGCNRPVSIPPEVPHLNVSNPDSATGGDPSDNDLVRAVLAGDEAALTVLYRRYVSAIYRFVLAQVRDRDEAEDLTSETFARMLRGLATFRHEASFKNWLYQIARNGIRNHRRSAGYRRTVALTVDFPAPPPAAGTKPDGAERALELLRPLPPRYRQVLELRFLAGRSIEDTAALMGITVANAKVLQHRALRKAASVHANRVEA